MDSNRSSSSATVHEFKDSSNTSAIPGSSQPHVAAAVASCDSILEYRLLKPLLRHPSIRQDQQVVAALLQSSKPLQAAVAELALLPRQLPVVLRARNPQQAAQFEEWLQKHGRLLQGLAVQWTGGDHYSGGKFGWRPAAEAKLSAAVQQAAAAGALQLQSFTLLGSKAPLSLLQQLPAAHLTQLTAEVDVHNSMDAVQALSSLRSLTLHDGSVAVNQDAAAALPFAAAASSPQLTQLRISEIRPTQLHRVLGQLPPQLQQLHLAVHARRKPQELEALASWLQQHGHIISSLKVRGTGFYGAEAAAAWAAAWDAVASACQAAGAAAPPPAPDAAEPGSKPWQLQSFSADVGAGETAAAPVQLLQHLPAHSMTQLECCGGWADAGQAIPPAVNELSRLTGLRSLHLHVGQGAQQQSDQLLAPLSSLPQLAQLQLTRGLVRRVQLQHLQLPRLQQLQAQICSGLDDREGLLQLAHPTALTQLLLLDYGQSTCVLAPTEQLPPNLQMLSLYHGEDAASRSHGSSGSLQPLLPLSRLQKLHLDMHGGAPAASELAVLSSISSLKEVKLLCIWEDHSAPHLCTQLGEAAEAAAIGAAAAWLTLPVKALQWHSYRMPAAVVQRAGALQGLTSLQLHTDCHEPADGLVPAHLAAMLQLLTGLRQLRLACNGTRKVIRGSAAASYSVGEVAMSVLL